MCAGGQETGKRDGNEMDSSCCWRRGLIHRTPPQNNIGNISKCHVQPWSHPWQLGVRRFYVPVWEGKSRARCEQICAMCKMK